MRPHDSMPSGAGTGAHPWAEDAGADLSSETLTALRERIRDGVYDEPTVAERLAEILVRRGLVPKEPGETP